MYSIKFILINIGWFTLNARQLTMSVMNITLLFCELLSEEEIKKILEIIFIQK